jgi:hypothetical protein
MQIPMSGKSVYGLIASMSLMAMAFVAAAPLSAAKGGQVPFHATFDTVFQSNIEYPLIHVTVQGTGEAEHLGRTSTFTTDQTGDLVANQTTATYTLIAATYTVIHGTGRFAGASGNGTLVGSAQFTGPTSGVGEFTLDGTISSPGSLK